MQTIRNLTRQHWRLLSVYGLGTAWLATTAMHIPDGYLSPITAIILYALVIPFWYRGLQALRTKVNARSIPMIALMAAFSFIIMMLLSCSRYCFRYSIFSSPFTSYVVVFALHFVCQRLAHIVDKCSVFCSLNVRTKLLCQNSSDMCHFG